MQKGEGKPPVSISLIVCAVVSLLIGWFVIGKITSYKQTRAIAAIAAQPNQTQLAFNARVAREQNGINLLYLSRKLLQKHEWALAQSGLERTVELLPNNKDALYLLAWTTTQQALNHPAGSSVTITQASQLIDKASSLDPIDENIRTLAKTIASLKTVGPL